MATTHNDGAPIAEDEAGFKRGRGTMLAGLLIAGALAMAGVWSLLSGGDDARVYGELGRKINNLRQTSFDEFWACAFTGKDVHELNSNTELTAQLDSRAAEGGRAYAAYLRDHCVEALSDIEPTLESLIIPDELKTDVESLKSATRDLRSRMSAFIAYLDTPNQTYASEVAKPQLSAISKAWFDFCQAHASINRTLRAKLKHPK